MNKIKNFFKSLWKDESAQGMAEYVLLIVVVVAIAIMFKPKIVQYLESKTAKVGESIEAF